MERTAMEARAQAKYQASVKRARASYEKACGKILFKNASDSEKRKAYDKAQARLERAYSLARERFEKDSFLGTFVCKAEKKEKRVERRFHAWVQADRMYRRRFHGKHASSNAKKWMRNKTAQLQRDGKHPNDAKVCWDRYEDGVFICTEVYTRLGADFDWAE